MWRHDRLSLAVCFLIGCSSPDDVAFSPTSTSTSSGGGACIPGQQIACACGGGAEGFQTCNASGAAFDACSCATGATTGVGGSGGTGGNGAGGDAAGGSATGGGGGGSTSCLPGATMPCYDGPAGTSGVGECVNGTATCLADGTAYGACTGQVVPVAETCSTPTDDDCDGLANEEGADCTCVPGATSSCYTGPAGTEDVGLCHGGLQLCDADGTGYGPCGGDTTPVADDCNTPADEDCSGANASCNVAVCLWSKRYDGSSIAEAIAINGAGQIVVAGAYYQSTDFGSGMLPSTNGHAGIFVTKLDLSGGLLWSKGFVEGSTMDARSVAFTANGDIVVAGDFTAGKPDLGGGLLAASSSNGVLVAKYDAAGNHVWSKAFLGIARGNGMALDPSGNIIVTGHVAGAIDFGGGALSGHASINDIFVAKLDPNGQHIWSKRFGDMPNGDVAYAVATDAMGAIWLTGSGSGAIDFGGGPLLGVGSGVVIAKLGPDGSHLFSMWGGNGGIGLSIQVDPSGNPIVGGNFTGTVDLGGGPLTSAGGQDLFLAKLGPTGTHLWSKRFGDAGGQSYVNLAVNTLGHIVLTGGLVGSVDFGGGVLTEAGGADVFVVKLDAFGGHLYSKTFGDAGGQSGQAIAVDATGNGVVTGLISSPMDFGCGALTPMNPKPNTFVAKLSP